MCQILSVSAWIEHDTHDVVSNLHTLPVQLTLLLLALISLKMKVDLQVVGIATGSAGNKLDMNLISNS